MRFSRKSVQGTSSAEHALALVSIGLLGLTGMGGLGVAMNEAIADTGGGTYAAHRGVGPSAQAAEGDEAGAMDAGSLASGAGTGAAGPNSQAAELDANAAGADGEGETPETGIHAAASGEDGGDSATNLGRYGEMPPPERTGPGVGSFLKRALLMTPLSWFKKDWREASFTMWKSWWHALEELPALMSSFIFEMVPNMIYHGRWDQLGTFAKTMPGLIFEGMKYDLDTFRNGSPAQAGRSAAYMMLDYAPVTWHMGKFASRKTLAGARLAMGGELAEGMSLASRTRMAKFQLNAALLGDVVHQRGMRALEARSPGTAQKLSERAGAIATRFRGFRARVEDAVVRRVDAAQTAAEQAQARRAALRQAELDRAVLDQSALEAAELAP